MNQQKYDYLDVVARMVSNYRQDKPLLEDAMLFRGSRFGDQIPSKSTPEQLHGHLLPQVAANYTHGWRKSDTFIDTYPIDRENTRFYANLNLDEHLKGNAVKSYSVADVERAIRPLVENLAYHPRGNKAWQTNVDALEKVIKSSFYEAGIPVRQPDGVKTQPQEKFLYSGTPKANSVSEVLGNLEKLTPANETKAKVNYALARPTDTVKAISQIETTHPEAARAFKVLQQAVQRDHAKTVLTQYGSKPFSSFMEHVQKELSTDAHSRVLRLAQGLGQSLDSSDPNVRARALTVTGQIGKLDLATATIKDIGQVIASVNTSTSTVTAKPASQEKMPTETSRTMAQNNQAMAR